MMIRKKEFVFNGFEDKENNEMLLWKCFMYVFNCCWLKIFDIIFFFSVIYMEIIFMSVIL